MRRWRDDLSPFWLSSLYYKQLQGMHHIFLRNVRYIVRNYHRVFLAEQWLVRTRFSEKKCGEGRIVLAWASLHEDASLIKPMKCPLHSSSIVLRAGTS